MQHNNILFWNSPAVSATIAPATKNTCISAEHNHRNIVVVDEVTWDNDEYQETTWISIRVSSWSSSESIEGDSSWLSMSLTTSAIGRKPFPLLELILKQDNKIVGKSYMTIKDMEILSCGGLVCQLSLVVLHKNFIIH